MQKKFLGLAGRRRSGKDTLARVLTLYIHSCKVLHFAAALKGQAFLDLSESAAWMPYLSDNGRKVLQGLGSGMFQIHPLGNQVWVSMAKALADFVSERNIIISDVRMQHEVDAIRSWGGKIVKIVHTPSTTSSVDFHITEESVDNIVADYEIPRDTLLAAMKMGWSKLLDDVIFPLVSAVGWDGELVIPPRKPRIYISTNISSNHKDFVQLYDDLRLTVSEAGFIPILPIYPDSPDFKGEVKDYDWLLNAIRDVGMVEGCNQLVASDLRGIGSSDGILAIYTSPSVGVSMEIAVGAMMGKPVVVVCQNMELLYHPWIWAFSQGNVYHTLSGGIRRLRELFGLGGDVV